MRTCDSSRRIELLRFPLIVGVVFIHSYDINPAFAGAKIGLAQMDFVTDFVRSVISLGVACTAVPLLFLISGYLFFASRPLTAVSFVAKLKSRSHTLLVPFLVWNIATLICLAIAQAAPATQVFFSGNSLAVDRFTFSDFFNAIWGIGRPPISYQFWFIRDLMLLVLIAPCIEFLNRSSSTIYLSIYLICLLADTNLAGLRAVRGGHAVFFNRCVPRGSRMEPLCG